VCLAASASLANVPWCKLQRGPARMRRCGTPAAAPKRAAAEAICSRRDAVPLPLSEAARPPGAANGPLPASHQS
jgi:hypothetical protein